MKKIIILIVLALCLVSCIVESGEKESFGPKSEITTKVITSYEITNNGTYLIKEITYNGETHEYIEFHGQDWFGLSHWEGCKYCKKHNHN